MTNVICGLAGKKTGSALCPTLVIEYGTILLAMTCYDASKSDHPVVDFDPLPSSTGNYYVVQLNVDGSSFIYNTTINYHHFTPTVRINVNKRQQLPLSVYWCRGV